MKKQLLYPVMLFGAIFFTASSQAQSFERGTNVAGIGIGLGSSIGSFSYGSQTPGFALHYERGIWDVGGPGVISLGGYAGFKGFKYEGNSGSYQYSQKWNYTILGIRGAYHYSGLADDRWDLYGGLMLSYDILHYSYEDNSGYNNDFSGGDYGSGTGFTAFAGGRYFFNEQLAAFGEIGYGVAYLTLGVALRF